MAEEILTVVFTGLIVVFAVLILLTALIWLFGKLFGLFSKKDSGKKKDKSEGAPESAPVKAAAQNVQNTVSAAESDGLTDEVLAVITAAVYSYSESTGTAYQVKGIRRVSSGRPAWAFAGIWDSTRPF